MLVIPAVDIREGRCVRLFQGRIEGETVYSTDPVAVALEWASRGAPWLHVVDLDGAFTGRLQNLDVIEEILQRVEVPVQVGGGIRSLESIERLLSLGVARVVLGTVAITDPPLVAQAVARYGERIVVGIDSREGKVAVEGWVATVEKDAYEFAAQMKELGVKRIIFTDVSRDGTLRGPDIPSIREMARRSGLKIIAAGGISTLEDIMSLRELEREGLEGVILGKALYQGNFTLEEALEAAEGRR